jgi:hypothetical protein
MRFRLRTLLIVVTLAPPMLALAWFIAHDDGAANAAAGLVVALLPFGLALGIMSWTIARAVKRHDVLRQKSTPEAPQTVSPDEN